MRKVVFSLGAALVLTLASCSAIPAGAGIGVIYTGTSEGSIATSNNLGTKAGTSSRTGVLGLVVVGDASIRAAANNTGIRKSATLTLKNRVYPAFLPLINSGLR